MDELAKLEPCPFCGVDMVASDHPRRRSTDHPSVIFTHPDDNDCILERFQVSESMVEEWNRRAALSGVRVPYGTVNVESLNSIVEKMRRADYMMALSDLLGLLAAAKGERDE